MNHTGRLSEDQGISFSDHEFAVVGLRYYRKSLVDRWAKMDRLVADRAYEQTKIARRLRGDGLLDDDGLEQVYAEIDAQLAEYDGRPGVFQRHELLKEIDASIARHVKASRQLRSGSRGAENAA